MIKSMKLTLWNDIQRYIEFLRQKDYIVSFSCFKNNFKDLSLEFLRYDLHPHSICSYLKTNPTTKGHCVKNKHFLALHTLTSPIYSCCYAGVEEYVFPVYHENTFLLYIHVSGYRGNLPKSKKFMERTALKCTDKFRQLYFDLSETVPAFDTVKSFVKPLEYMLIDLYVILGEPSENNRDSTSKQIYHNIIKYIHENYMFNLSCETIAEQFMYSASHLRFLFKKEAGVPIHAKINEIRMENAKKMLTTTSMTVTEISQYCGFDDSNYFSTLFKKHNGISPLEYRKKNKID